MSLRLVRARLARLSAAAGRGSLISAFITHNPFSTFLIIFGGFAVLGGGRGFDPVRFALLVICLLVFGGAPFLGGVAARGKTKIGPAGGLYVSLFIASWTATPFLLILPLMWVLRARIEDLGGNMLAVLVATGIYMAFSALAAALGIFLRSLKPMTSMPIALFNSAPIGVPLTPERLAATSDVHFALGPHLLKVVGKQHAVEPRSIYPN